MSFKIFSALAGMLIFSQTSEAIVDSNENLSPAPKMDNPDSSKENLNRLKEAHDFGQIFGGYEEEPSSYQSLN